MDKVLIEFLNYGIAGLIIIVLIIFIRYLVIYIKQLEDNHTEERRECREDSNRMADKFAEVIVNNTKALTIIHGGLKGQKETLVRIEKKVG